MLMIGFLCQYSRTIDCDGKLAHDNQHAGHNDQVHDLRSERKLDLKMHYSPWCRIRSNIEYQANNMKLQAIPGKVINKLSQKIHALMGVDPVSGTRINGRDDLTRIGNTYGGWIVPSSLLDSDSICYCVGCGEDISFDLGMIDTFGCDVYGFDPTPKAIEYVKEHAGDNPKYHFQEVGLWDKEDTLKFYVPKNPDHVSHSLVNLQKTDEYISVKVDRLSTLMERLGHQRIDVLKLDIEGAEYKVIESAIEDGIDIRILCVEYDECFNPLDAGYKDRIKESVDSLYGMGFTLVCAEGNGNYTFVREA